MAVNLNKDTAETATKAPGILKKALDGVKHAGGQAKAFAGKHKAALIAAGVGGAVGAGGTYLAGRSRKSGDE